MPRYETLPPNEPDTSEYKQFVDYGFTNLAPNAGPQWYIIGNGNPMYKCVAWTLGVRHEIGPNEVNGTYPVATVTAFYNNFGYQEITLRPPGTWQVYDVLTYGKRGLVEHVAVYLDVPGVGLTWTSKMGTAQLITHDWLQLAPGPYGNVLPTYYTHNGTMPGAPFVAGETPEQTIQRLLQESGLDRL
jgi:hypothetical protein